MIQPEGARCPVLCDQMGKWLWKKKNKFLQRKTLCFCNKNNVKKGESIRKSPTLRKSDMEVKFTDRTHEVTIDTVYIKIFATI